MHSNRYIFIYSAVMVVVVAILLTVVAIGLKPQQQYNVKVEKMQNILSSVNIPSTTKNAEELFNKYIVGQKVINVNNQEQNSQKAFEVNVEQESKKTADKRLLPIYICKTDKGETKYIFPTYGKGLWGPIWGYISVNDDKNTVYGAFFDHKGETPGLGAEIATEVFQSQFAGKKLFDETGNFVSIKAVKGGADKNDTHGVDAISGGTITSNGLSKMLMDELKPYENFLKQKN
ncbi:MAG TPA: NADH:ubiquinone reductase (Na(+)-transporting) subunit C [Bacteroidales bacterium]|jgi:Na+-transporting NADH:ubiquinone oxidoreductase subunit C|nr:NADH:ubiquinone reductase (Na(+)-transporting) subunit C [Bacteroidales bacterium]HNV96444.1 NADH:ubiquinone reductase (Na(+)-transporting) subunit C [Bacteroidales bacterium]HOU97370.1 NADH:ubiquinone reductase (Na(+)-transporting) subunit C [Bacteroidales bacterium]